MTPSATAKIAKNPNRNRVNVLVKNRLMLPVYYGRGS